MLARHAQLPLHPTDLADGIPGNAPAGRQDHALMFVFFLLLRPFLLLPSVSLCLGRKGLSCGVKGEVAPGRRPHQNFQRESVTWVLLMGEEGAWCKGHGGGWER